LTLARLRATVAREAVMSRIFALALAGALSLAAAAPAFAANIFELNFGLSGPRYDALVPLCDDPGVLGQISSKFAHKESEYWASNLEILGIDRIHQASSFRPWTGAPQAIPRRFCSGLARTSDGARHAIHYSILENTGWLGVGWGVEWCVVGLDRDWAYNPACRMARP
jgi:hypothetical protein